MDDLDNLLNGVETDTTIKSGSSPEMAIDRQLEYLMKSKEFEYLSFDQQYAAYVLYHSIMYVFSGQYAQGIKKILEIDPNFYYKIKQDFLKFIENQKLIIPETSIEDRSRRNVLEQRFVEEFQQYFKPTIELNSNIFLISGNPGTGKTQIIKFVLTKVKDAIIKSLHMKQKLVCGTMAFSHSAVLTIKIRTGATSLTTSSALKKHPIEVDDISYDATRPLFRNKSNETTLDDWQLAVLDECGMEPYDNIDKFRNLYQQRKMHCLLEFGDVNQLAPVEDKNRFGMGTDGKAFGIVGLELRLIATHRIPLFHPVQTLLAALQEQLNSKRQRRGSQGKSFQALMRTVPEHKIKNCFGKDIGYSTITAETFKTLLVPYYMRRLSQGSDTCLSLAFTNEMVKSTNETIGNLCFPDRKKDIGNGFYPGEILMSYKTISIPDPTAYFCNALVNSALYKVLWSSALVKKTFSFSYVDDATYQMIGDRSFIIEGRVVLLKSMLVEEDFSKRELAFIEKIKTYALNGMPIMDIGVEETVSSLFIVEPTLDNFSKLLRCYMQYHTIELEDGSCWKTVEGNNKITYRMVAKPKMRNCREYKRILNEDLKRLQQEFISTWNVFYVPQTDSNGNLIMSKSVDDFDQPIIELLINGAAIQDKDKLFANGFQFNLNAGISKALDFGNACTIDKFQGNQASTIFVMLDDVLRAAKDETNFLKMMNVICSRLKDRLFFITGNL